MKKYISILWKEYDKHFGCEASEVYTNKYWNKENSDVPPISVNLYKKEDTGRTYDVLITAGMSWKPFNFPPEDQSEKWSTELIMYFDKVEQEDIDWMLWLSSLPYFDNFALGYGHSVSYPEPLYGNSKLANFLFINTILKSDQNIFNGFTISPFPIDLLWVVPITSSEYLLKREQGLNPIYDLFVKNTHPLVLNKLRNCYVATA